jgi:hypothetical protein
VSASDAALGHRNLIAFSRALARWGRRGSLLEEGGVLAFAGGSWIPVIGNGAFRTDDSITPADLIGTADAFFAARRRGYSIKVRDSGQDDDLRAACEAAGFEAFGDQVPEMICRHPIDVPDLPPGTALRAVDDAQGIADFATVNADAYSTYGMPADVLGDMFDQPDVVLADDDAVIVVAYQDERPVATALTYLSDGIAGLQWVGTVADVRNQSLGRAVTIWATNVAFERGASSCTLQASPMGEPLYATLGYEPLYHYRDHVRWKAPVR